MCYVLFIIGVVLLPIYYLMFVVEIVVQSFCLLVALDLRGGVRCDIGDDCTERTSSATTTTTTTETLFVPTSAI